MVTNMPSTQQAERERLYGGKIVADNVAYEDYLRGEYGIHAEWVNGVVVEMSPVKPEHGRLNSFLEILFTFFLDRTTGGVVHRDPVVMKAKAELPARQPDLQVILPDRVHFIKANEVAGPANLVVEIISPESNKRDRGDKHDEYEEGGVDEYWILDQRRKEALFYVRGEDNLFHLQHPIDAIYTSSILPKLNIQVNVFWQERLPNSIEIVQMVEAMLKED